jgi:hypothetical protein
MVSKKERRIVQLIYLINTFTPKWEEKLDALGDMIQEVGPVQIFTKSFRTATISSIRSTTVCHFYMSRSGRISILSSPNRLI